MRDFDYFEPRSADEAVSLLVKYGDAAKIIAGGTDLVVRMIAGSRRPKYIINIKAVPGLDYIDCSGDVIRIGATTTMRAIATSAELKKKCPQIVEVARQFASITIANMATIGGNLCNASPAADTGAPLVVLSAKAQITGLEVTRAVLVEEFFTGPGSTVMQSYELLTEIQIPVPPAALKWAYIKHGVRSVSDLALTTVAALVNIKNGIFVDARVALGAVYPTPMRASQAEAALKNKKATETTVEKAATLVREQCCPISDVRASADYRKQIAYVLTRRALMSCLNSK